MKKQLNDSLQGQKKLALTFLLSCLCLAPIASFAEDSAPTVDVMKDCEDSIAVVAIQMTFSEMMNIQMSKDQAEKAVASMKQSKDGSYDELAGSVREFCKILKQELKKEVKKDKTSK